MSVMTDGNLIADAVVNLREHDASGVFHLAGRLLNTIAEYDDRISDTEILEALAVTTATRSLMTEGDHFGLLDAAVEHIDIDDVSGERTKVT